MELTHWGSLLYTSERRETSTGWTCATSNDGWAVGESPTPITTFSPFAPVILRWTAPLGLSVTPSGVAVNEKLRRLIPSAQPKAGLLVQWEPARQTATMPEMGWYDMGIGAERNTEQETSLYGIACSPRQTGGPSDADQRCCRNTGSLYGGMVWPGAQVTPP